MADANPNDSDDASTGFTLDLSTGKAPSRRKRKRKGPAPVVQQTINLSTPRTEKPAEPAKGPDATATSSRKTKGASSASRKKQQAPRSAGTSLADLLDPETLARLRGE